MRFSHAHFFLSSLVKRNVGEWVIFHSLLFLTRNSASKSWDCLPEIPVGFSDLLSSSSAIAWVTEIACLSLCSGSLLIQSLLQPREQIIYCGSPAKNSVPTHAFWIKYTLHCMKYLDFFLTCLNNTFFSATVFSSLPLCLSS